MAGNEQRGGGPGAGPLTPEEAVAIERRLLGLRQEYLSRAGKIAVDVTERLPQDSEERAVALENSDVLDALGQEALDEIAGIDLALARLRNGQYGQCAGCGGRIEGARLEAYPAATRCIDCKRAAEGG